jgi:uncharacterized membrane protein
MERMLVVVFDREDAAYEAGQALDLLGEQDAIALIAETVVVKDGDGRTTITRLDNANPEATMGGTALGSFLGLLGGPVGLAAGSAIGLASAERSV